MDFYTELAEQVSEELNACIGCHACMRACPLPSSEMVTIGALNDLARGGELTPILAEFVNDCTQCHRCVPVCPVDISRSRIVLWNKLKLVGDPNQPLTIDVAGQSLQSGWTAGTLARQLISFPLFTGVSDLQLRRLMPQLGLRRLLPGTVLTREGEYGQSLYVILEGLVELGAATEFNHTQKLVDLGPGNFVNEMSVLADRPNDVTVTAVQETVIVEFSRWSIHQLMNESPQFAATMEGIYRSRALDTYLRKVPIFHSLPEEAIERLMEASRLEVYPAGAALVREGDVADAFYIIRSGFAKVSRMVNDREVVVSYSHEGDYFGETALLHGGTRNATVTAATRLEVVMIGRSSFAQIMLRHAQIRDQLMQVSLEREQMGLGSVQLPDASLLGPVDILLKEGLLQANNLLIIDQRLCIDCNNCVEACQRRHGHSRLVRRGITVGPILFPSACRHCEDPLCLLCSVDGIVRGPDGEIQIKDDNCVGCGACAERCPYDNIQMAMREAPPQPNFLQQLFPRFFGLPTPPTEEEEFDRVAVKCDLCAGYSNGPACVRNCPTGAAQRVDPSEYFTRQAISLS